ncbi:hypothetical protein [Maritalea myrionectae]|nr:hypothetical protein [Maritalea myrionectae]
MAQIVRLAQTIGLLLTLPFYYALYIEVSLPSPFDGKMRQKSVAVRTVFKASLYMGYRIIGRACCMVQKRVFAACQKKFIFLKMGC